MSFKTSAKLCSNPYGPTRLGPMRSWTLAKSLRSAQMVMIATSPTALPNRAAAMTVSRILVTTASMPIEISRSVMNWPIMVNGSLMQESNEMADGHQPFATLFEAKPTLEPPCAMHRPVLQPG